MKHGKVKTFTPQDDGSTKIVSEGYYDVLNSIKEEITTSIMTTQSTLLTDVLKCLDHLKQGSPDLTIRIITDKNLNPTRIEKTWTVYKKKIK